MDCRGCRSNSKAVALLSFLSCDSLVSAIVVGGLRKEAHLTAMLRLVTTLALAALPVADAIIVTPLSPCSSQCGNLQSSIAPDDIECSQNNYGDYTGSLFSGCLDCEISSGFGNGASSDVKAALCM